MTLPFREHHLLQILEAFEKQNLPLDVFLRSYFRSHPAIGSKDRKEICNTLYVLIRYRLLLDHFLQEPNWQKRLSLYKSKILEKERCDLPRNIEVSFPLPFYSFLEETLGKEAAYTFCLVSNEQAPTTIRVNTLLTTREALAKEWEKTHRVSLCKKSPQGIQFKEKVNFLEMTSFKQGLFEVQDEHSQLIAALVAARPGDLVLDYCAGSGGKSLAIAPLMKNQGQLFLYDIREAPLREAKKRLKRAQIHNAQIVKDKKQLKGKMDWVLVDAPCTGIGTLRRNPDMKWKWRKEDVFRIVQEQKSIFAEALTFVKPQGKIVYATCSVLPQENEEQAKFFSSHFSLTPTGQTLSLFPESQGGDGFFGIVFQKTTPLRYNNCI